MKDVFQIISAEEPLLEVIVNGKTLSACRNVRQCFLRRTDGEPDRDAVAPWIESSEVMELSCCSCKQPLHVNGTYGINLAILYVKHIRSWTTKPEEEEREESRSLNQYWMEDAEVVSTSVTGIEIVIFGEKEALNHCLLHSVSAKFIKMSTSSIKWGAIGSREPNERRFLQTHFLSLRRIPRRMLSTVCCIGL